MRDRRSLGLLILLVAALAIGVTARLNSAGLAGRAIAEPLQPPAQVGDCVLEPYGPPGMAVSADVVMTPSLSLGDCRATHFGEVYAVYDVSKGSASDYAGDCFTSADPYQYMGISIDAVDAWVPQVHYYPVLVRPRQREQDAGQRWAACAVMVPAGGAPLSQTVRGVFASGTAPGVFGYCTDSVSADNFQGVSCASPHRSELFGSYVFTQLDASQDQIQGSCRAFIAGQTGIPDLASSTDLQVVTYTQLIDPAATSPWTRPVAKGDRGQIMCLLTSSSGRRLAGSLLSLKTAPIPWA